MRANGIGKSKVGKSYKALTAVLVAWGLGAVSQPVEAGTHSYINMMRSSSKTQFFVQQSVDGEFGTYTAHGKTQDEAGNEVQTKQNEYWKGYGIGTTFGAEMSKFVQFVIGHTFINMRHQDDALQSLNGSRLNAGLRLAFQSPLANLEFGAGAQGSRLDYQKQLDSGTFYGSGVHYSLALNHFLSSNVSIYYEAKLATEHIVRSGGSTGVSSFDTDATLMGLGFRLWM